jgi:hypothetical protein
MYTEISRQFPFARRWFWMPQLERECVDFISVYLIRLDGVQLIHTRVTIFHSKYIIKGQREQATCCKTSVFQVIVILPGRGDSTSDRRHETSAETAWVAVLKILFWIQGVRSWHLAHLLQKCLCVCLCRRGEGVCMAFNGTCRSEGRLQIYF